MIDSLTSSISAILNNKRDEAFQTKVLKDTEILRKLSAAVANALYDIHYLKREEDSETNAFYDNCLTGILDIYEEMVGDKSKTEDKSEEQDLSSLGQNIAAEMKAVGEATDKENTGLLKTVSKSLTSLVKVATSELKQGMQMGKLLTKVEKTIGKDANKTKIIDENAKMLTPEGQKNVELDPTKINMNGVAKSMAKATADALNPVKLVKAFFTEILPYVIIFGLLVYGFITGFLGGDVYDFILVMGGIIVAAFLLYIAYQYIKANILFGFKIACEIMKLNMALAVQALQIAAIGIIIIAFLLVAGVLMVLLAGAFLLIAKGIATLIETITDSIIKFLKVAIETIATIPAMIGTMFGKMMRAIFGGESNDDSKGLEELVKNAVIPKMDDMIAAIKGINVDVKVDDKNNSLDNILSSGFTEILNAISDISKKLEDISPTSKNISIDFNDGMLFGYFGSISDNIKTIVDLVSNIVDNNAKKESEIIKQITNSTLEQNTKAIMNGYQITDGTMVLRDGYTAYATLDEEEKGTDLTQIVEKLDVIISHLGGIYDVESANSNAKADTSWWASLTEND